MLSNQARMTRMIGAVVIVACTLVFLSRTMVILQKQNDTLYTPLHQFDSHDEEAVRDESNALIALTPNVNATVDAEHVNELSIKLALLESENMKLKTEQGKRNTAELAHINELSAKLSLLERENIKYKIEQGERNTTEVAHVNELSTQLSLLETQNKRLNTESNVAGKKIECWDSEAFNDSRSNIEIHPIRETRLDFCTDRSSRACRRARTNYGDETKFLPVLRKLVNGECITLVTLGGSISYGAKAGGPLRAYAPKTLMALDLHLPCKQANGEAGKHNSINLAIASTHSGFHVGNIQSTPAYYDAAFKQADLVIIEFHTNDGNGSAMAQPEGILASKKIQYWTEALIQLIKLKAPQAALIYLESGALDWDLTRKPVHAPPYASQPDAHLDVLKYYDILQIDMMRMIGPLG